MVKSTHIYDYIIAGGGCAGLSLAMQLQQSGLSFKKVAIIDQTQKRQNDRTWCFWSRHKKHWFDELVYKRWSKFRFASSSIHQVYELNPYTYYLIRGIDFYEYCLKQLKQDGRFEFVTESIRQLSSTNNAGLVETPSSFYEGQYVFNSAFRNLDAKAHHVNYIQHFLGWVVESDMPVFEADCPVFMDFSVEQHNDCRFMYVIPHSSTKALVEYTGFSSAALSKEIYETEIKKYLSTRFQLNNYRLLETEYGEIPMAESSFINPYGKYVVNMGTAGGFSKPSTGYTFYFIQKHVSAIVQQLKTGGNLQLPSRELRFSQYDKIFMDVMASKKLPASDLFSGLFKGNKIETLLAFLNEESTYWEDLQIMNSSPKHYFIPSAIKKSFGG